MLPSILPLHSTVWRKRTLALGTGALLSALLAIAARAALPTGGHDILRGLASLLGTLLGAALCAVFLIGLAIHAVQWLMFRRASENDEP